MTLNNNIYVIGIDPHDAYAMHLRHLSIYIPYRGKLRRGKVTKCFSSDENYPRRKFSPTKIFPDEVFPDKVFSESGRYPYSDTRTRKSARS